MSGNVVPITAKEVESLASADETLGMLLSLPRYIQKPPQEGMSWSPKPIASRLRNPQSMNKDIGN